MDAIIRTAAMPRSQQLFGIQSRFRADERPGGQDRIDVPEIQESTRVSFSKGIAIQAAAPTRSAVDIYRVIQAL